MIARFTAVVGQMLIAFDQFVQVLIFGFGYIVGLAKERPYAAETISSRVGRADAKGARWARIAAAIIDWLAVAVGDAPNHCARNITIRSTA